MLFRNEMKPTTQFVAERRRKTDVCCSERPRDAAFKDRDVQLFTLQSLCWSTQVHKRGDVTSRLLIQLAVEGNKCVRVDFKLTWMETPILLIPMVISLLIPYLWIL